MFRIICLASFVGAVVAFVMIALFYFKNKSVVVPYIVFFAFIIVVGISAFFHIKGVDTTAEEPPTPPTISMPPDTPSLGVDDGQSSLSHPDNVSPSLTPNTVSVICDLAQFSRISTNELFDLMGSDGEKDPYGIRLFTNTGTEIHGDIYIFNDQQLEFVVAEDQVIRATYNAPKYYDLSGMSIGYDQKDNIPLMFGVIPDSRAKAVAETPLSYRLSPVNNSVADFWVTMMDTNAKTFDQVKATYNLNYSGI